MFSNAGREQSSSHVPPGRDTVGKGCIVNNLFPIPTTNNLAWNETLDLAASLAEMSLLPPTAPLVEGTRVPLLFRRSDREIFRSFEFVLFGMGLAGCLACHHFRPGTP